MRMRHRRIYPTLLGLVLVLATGAAALAAPDPTAGEGPQSPITTHTYLKAHPGERERLAAFIRANWFVMDAIAVERGLFRSYRLLANVDMGGDWDLLVEVIYNDACGYACVAEEFESIRRAHATVAVDGKGLPELGKVVRSEQLQPVH